MPTTIEQVMASRDADQQIPPALALEYLKQFKVSVTDHAGELFQGIHKPIPYVYRRYHWTNGEGITVGVGEHDFIGLPEFLRPYFTKVWVKVVQMRPNTLWNEAHVEGQPALELIQKLAPSRS